MIGRYLDLDDLFTLYAGELKRVCAMTDEGTLELQNLATYPHAQRQGYAHALVEHLFVHCRVRGIRMPVGTCDSPPTLLF